MPSDLTASPLSHSGVVQSLRGDIAQVAVDTAGCQGCGKRSGCSIGKLAGGRRQIIDVPAHIGLETALKPGDHVQLDLDPDALHRAALTGYLLPATLMVIGAVLGQQLTATDTGAVSGLLAGLLSGLLLLRRHARLSPQVRRIS